MNTYNISSALSQSRLQLPPFEPALIEKQTLLRRLLQERVSNVRPEIIEIVDPHPELVTPDLIREHPGIVDNLPRRYSRQYREVMDSDYFAVYDQAVERLNLPLGLVIRLIDHYISHRDGRVPLTPVRKALLAKTGARIYREVRALGLTHHEAVS